MNTPSIGSRLPYPAAISEEGEWCTATPVLLFDLAKARTPKPLLSPPRVVSNFSRPAGYYSVARISRLPSSLLCTSCIRRVRRQTQHGGGKGSCAVPMIQSLSHIPARVGGEGTLPPQTCLSCPYSFRQRHSGPELAAHPASPYLTGRSWQSVTFERQPASFIRIVGTHNTANETCFVLLPANTGGQTCQFSAHLPPGIVFILWILPSVPGHVVPFASAPHGLRRQLSDLVVRPAWLPVSLHRSCAQPPSTKPLTTPVSPVWTALQSGPRQHHPSIVADPTHLQYHATQPRCSNFCISHQPLRFLFIDYLSEMMGHAHILREMQLLSMRSSPWTYRNQSVV
ncbi:BTB/POZ domain-containing protein 9 [Tupaia chinensis]|uniref:BTB/POZ domain-containing protein 9 n=1 Tax=Tupaia chinensis TaxID=246437 RepID=L9KUF3_TUPCH|nr:BTB/POZ domain-containing protein 9 [Tupaia chinensis]